MTIYNVRDSNLANEINELEAMFRDIKSNQKMGYDVTKVKEAVASGSAYDFTIPPSSQTFKRIIFTAATQEYPNGQVVWQIGSGTISNTASSSDFSMVLDNQTYNLSTNNKQVVIEANIYNYNTTQTLYFKTFFIATDIGSVSITS